MSERDQKLVQALGIPVAQLATALDKSRQTVTRGIRAEAPYLKPTDLARALETWRTSDAGLYTIAKARICEIYPEVADSILEAARAGGSVTFSTDVPGEYWLLAGDFVGFRNDLPTCAKQVEMLCSLPTAQVKLFVNERDERAASRLAGKFGRNTTLVIPCRTVDLSMVPTTLLRIDHDDNLDLFGVSDSGFVPLSRHEASRLRLVAEDVLRASVPRDRVDAD